MSKLVDKGGTREIPIQVLKHGENTEDFVQSSLHKSVQNSEQNSEQNPTQIPKQNTKTEKSNFSKYFPEQILRLLTNTDKTQNDNNFNTIQCSPPPPANKPCSASHTNIILTILFLAVSQIFIASEFYKLRISHDLLQSQVVQITEVLTIERNDETVSSAGEIKSRKQRSVSQITDKQEFFDLRRIHRKSNCDCPAGPAGPPGADGKF